MTHYPTIADIKNSACSSRNPQLVNSVEKKRNKYSSQIIEFDGHKFRSKREYNYYLLLKAMQTLGQITDLQLQVPFELNQGGTHSLKYYADFVFIEEGVKKIIDVKGFRTALYRKKKKLMLKIYGVEIKEV